MKPHQMLPCAVHSRASSATGPNNSPGTTGTFVNIFRLASESGDCANQTWQRVCTRVDIIRPSSLDIRAKACNDASIKPCVGGQPNPPSNDVDRRWERELPMLHMRASMWYALQSRSSVVRHCGRRHLAFILSISSSWTVRDAMAGSTAGLCLRPNVSASCIAAKARPSEYGFCLV